MELKSITFPGLDGEYQIPAPLDPSQFAPSGYGFGENLVSLGNANDDIAFTEALTEQFNAIGNKAKLIAFTYGGACFIGTLWNAGNNYGTLVANSYVEPNVAYRFKQLVRICNNGTWGAWVDNSPAAFAPSGYGLGTASGKEIADCNSATANGFYSLSGASLQNPPPGNLAYGSMLVLNRYAGNHITQVAYYRNDTAIRTYYNSVWSEWEWDNPPMKVDVEYRTTERWLGKAVYCKVIEFGALPNATYKAVNHDATITRCIRYNLTNKHSNKMLTGGHNISDVAVSTSVVQITTSADLSAHQAYVTLWYTKD